MITRKNITLHELIGLETKIINSSNKYNIGIKGKIIDETKSMLVIKTEKGVKKIQKKYNEWKFSFETEDVILQGNKIAKRSHDRLGMKI